MKTRLAFLSCTAALLAVVPAVGAAESGATKSDPRPRRELRSLSERPGEKHLEKEIVAFLGVETAPVSTTLAVQLGLPRGSGLVVNHIVPKSPAENVLQPHDILVKFDDQILIETRQFSVLVRNRKEGDEVTLTYVRGGKQATAKVKLAQHEVPKLATAFITGPRPFSYGIGDGRFELFAPGDPAEGEREHMDRVLSLIRRAPDGAPMRIQIDRDAGPGFRAIGMNTANSNLVFSDDDGSLNLTIKAGVKTLVAKNAKGEELFAGPVTTPEERKAVPPPVRERLERLEGMQDVTFHTDGDFQGAETKVVRPLKRSISLPHVVPPPAPPRRSFSF